MTQLQPVLWSKGAFLQPQHLQSQDLYLDSQLKFVMDAMCCYPYGFQKVTVDPVRLAGGYFGLSEAAGLFPDGLPFALESDFEPEPRELTGAFREGQTSLIVSLAVPQYRAGVRNVSFTPGERTSTRFTADSLNLPDETTGMNAKPVQIARKNLRYLLPQDDHTGHSVLPVARILKKGDRLEADRSFVPPLLYISASSYVVSILRDITGILGAKSQELSANRRGRGQGIPTVVSPAETAEFWLLYTVNQHYPVFRNLLSNTRLHPQEPFAAMLALAGALTAFTLKIDPNELPVYNHDDLGSCFGQLDAMLRDLLETAIPRFVVFLPLKPTGETYVYSAFIPEDRFLVDSRVYLSIKSESNPERRIEEQAIKIAATGQINQIINVAVSGVRLSRPASLPNTIPMRLGHQYFQLDTSGDYWQGIVRSRSLAAYVPSSISEPVMELVILLKTQV